MANERGVPDIYCCYRGFAIVIEVKQPGKKATKIQAVQMQKWRKAGGLATTVTSIDDVEALIKYISDFDITVARKGQS